MQALKIILSLASFLTITHADAIVDQDDVPSQCKSICEPIVKLTNTCSVSMIGCGSESDPCTTALPKGFFGVRDGSLLEAQCICTNDSFDVKRISALCASCMHQAKQNLTSSDPDAADDVDLRDINDLLSTCQWPSSTYKSADATSANGITVKATSPTAISQLTTTIGSGSGNSDATITPGTTTGTSEPTAISTNRARCNSGQGQGIFAAGLAVAAAVQA